MNMSQDCCFRTGSCLYGLAATAVARSLCFASLSFYLVFGVAGCTGTPGSGEMVARNRSLEVAAEYRPKGEKPALPVLNEDSPLSDYLKFAMLNQPRVEAAYYNWLASIERITAARSLPDPQLTFQTDIENIVTSVMPGLMMNFPGPGKLGVRAEIATAESQVRYSDFESAVLESAFAVKRTYYQLYFLFEKIRVVRENLGLLSELESLARSQNEVGKGTLQDILRAQLEKERLRTELANLEDSRVPLIAEFHAALGLLERAAHQPIPKRFESTSLDLSSAELLAAAMAQSTQLRAVKAEVEAAEAAIRLAGKSTVPDFSIGAMVDVKMNPTMTRPVASVSLPIWRDKIAAQLAEAQAAKRAAEARLSESQIDLAVSFAERSFQYREATRNLTLITKELLPKARQSFEVAHSGYLTGQIDFFNLADTERTLLALQLEKVETATRREIVLAELSLIIQGMPPAGSAAVPVSGGMSKPASSTGGAGRTNGMGTMQ